MSKQLLDVQGLSVTFTTHQGTARVLEKVSLSLQAGEILGLVGETGCGKSVLARSILRLIPQPPGRIHEGRIMFQEKNLLKLSARAMRSVRGRCISMIFQEPLSSLNPVFTIGNQMREMARLHLGLGREAANEHCAAMLARVRLPDARGLLRKYPHELSGGQRQRVMIAMELSCGPQLLLADEPTTALDVTVQGQILQIIKEQAAQRDMAVLLITHDMGVVAQTCDRVAVMYAGVVVETATVADLFARPEHPYTQGLIAAIPGRERIQQLLTIPGTVPDLVTPPPGCRYHPRCVLRVKNCNRIEPELSTIGAQHAVACHLSAGKPQENWRRP
ncbi:MAG TPA: ABC transporter ATP-binding protein [Desulfonatronum sp.]|nr:ABC transporter ATP-binding protein [Desulfonatronum sp.]